MIDQVKKRIIELERQPEEGEENIGNDGDSGGGDEGGGREGDPLDEAETLFQVRSSSRKHW